MLIQADARHIPLKDECVQCVVTSPPYYGLRDYAGCDCSQGRFGRGENAGPGGEMNYKLGEPNPDCPKCGGTGRVDIPQIGLEESPEGFVEELVGVFSEVWRVLRDDGTAWLNLGDSYAANRPYQVHNTKGAGGHTYSKGSSVPIGLKSKDLIGIPWRVALALQADGWYLRSDIIWHKPNPMPESVTDRPTKSHEYLFLLTKSARYYYDADAILEPANQHKGKVLDNRESGTGLARGMFGQADRQGNFQSHPNGRNKRSVWTITTKPTPYAHFATFPPKLIEPCILAGSKLRVAEEFNRVGVGCDLAYHDISKIRTRNIQRQLVGL